MRIVIFLLILLGAPLTRAECTLVLPRAGFANAIVDREPEGNGLGGGDRLWFFTEVLQGAGDTLYHQWYLDGNEDVRIALPVGADRWRTWSSRRAAPGQRLTVRVLSAAGCDLGEYALGPAPSNSHNVLAAARDALARGDITGARLQVRQAQEAGDRDPALARFLDQDLALAEAGNDIAGQRLVMAASRLQALTEQPLSDEQRQQLKRLEAQQAEAVAALDQDLRRRLATLQRTLDTLPPTTRCRDDAQAPAWLPAPERDWLLETDRESAGPGRQRLAWLDRRTGLAYRLEAPCLD